MQEVTIQAGWASWHPVSMDKHWLQNCANKGFTVFHTVFQTWKLQLRRDCGNFSLALSDFKRHWTSLALVWWWAKVRHDWLLPPSRDQHRRCTSMSSWYFTRDLLSFFPPWHPLIALVPLASFDETIHGNSTSCLTCFYSLQIILQVHCEAINCAAWLPLPKLLRVPAARHVPCTVYILAVFERDFPLRFCKVEADAWFLCFN